MFTVITLMLTGMLVGYLLRRHPLKQMGMAIDALIWLLLFLLGVEVGSDRRLTESLHTLGLEALMLAGGGVLGSAIAAQWLWHAVSRRSYGQTSSQAGTKTNALHALRGSAVIVCFFVAGAAAGLTGIVPAAVAKSGISFYALCVLMCCVGLHIGNQPQTLKSFRTLNPRLTLLPLLTIAGTLAGTAAVSLLLNHRSLTDCLAVGSGFGYYSLSSIFITEYRGAELGTVALLANIVRELITLLGAPLLARTFGRLAPIASGGATTMDTTLPVILQTSGQELAVLSIFHGFMVDFSVPFLVTLWCSL